MKSYVRQFNQRCKGQAFGEYDEVFEQLRAPSAIRSSNNLVLKGTAIDLVCLLMLRSLCCYTGTGMVAIKLNDQPSRLTNMRIMQGALCTTLIEASYPSSVRACISSFNTRWTSFKLNVSMRGQPCRLQHQAPSIG